MKDNDAQMLIPVFGIGSDNALVLHNYIRLHPLEADMRKISFV